MWRKNFAWKMSGLLVGGGTALAFQIVTMRYLGPRGYGFWSLAIGWAGLFAVIVDYGFNPLLARDIARKPFDARHYVRSLLKGKILLIVPSGLILAFTWRYFPAVSLSGTLLLIAFIYLCCASTAESLQAITYALERFRIGACLSIAQKVLPALTGFYVIHAGGSAHRLFATVTAMSLIIITASFFYIDLSVPTSIEPGEKSRLTPLMKAGLPLFLQNLFIMVYFRVDTLMIGHYTSADQAGLYGAAYRFFELSNIIPTALTAAWISPLSKDLEHHTSSTQFYAALKVFMLFAFGGVFVLEAIAWASPHVLGSAYVLTRPVLMCLSLAVLFYFPNFLLSSVLVLKGKPVWNTLLAGLCAVFNVLVNMWCIPRWGAIAAAWTTLTTEGLLFIFSFYAVHRLLHDSRYAKEV